MSNLDEQLLLFEREVAAFDTTEVQINDGASNNQTGQNSIVSSMPTSSKTVFVPNQLRPSSHTQNHAGKNLIPAQFFSNSALTSVIESGPELYKNPSSKSQFDSTQNLTQQQPSMMKTMALPSDVELLAAKRQSSKAHQNSYLGQVLRGEKKMKRFVRSCGGEKWEDPSLAEWDPNDFRIFCGDLGNEVSDELLAKAFRKYPSFQKAKVVRDGRTNKSKGYGFVSFKTQEDFIRAMKEMDGKYVGNRPIKLRKSNWKDRNIDQVRKKTKEKKKLGLT